MSDNVITGDQFIVPYIADLSGIWAIEERFARLMYTQLCSYVNSGFDLSAMHPTLKAAYDDERQKSLKDRFVNWYNGNIAVVNIEGTLMKDEPPSRLFGASTITYPQITEVLTDLVADGNAEEIILKIDSGGGSTVGALPCSESIADLAKKKKITAFCDDFCCSGAYLLASQCSRIISAQGSILGSIGVFTVLTDTSERDEERGLKRTVVSTSKIKGAGADGKVTEELEAEVQREIDEWHDLFRASVISGRNISEKEMDAAATGQVFLPDKALELKLIDEVVNFHDLVDIKTFSQESRDTPETKPDGGYESMDAKEREELIAQAKAEAKAAVQADVDAATKRAEEAESRANTLAAEKTEAEKAELEGKASTSEEWKERALAAERKEAEAKQQADELKASQEAFRKAEVQRENESRVRICNDWIDRKVSEGRVMPAGVPKLKAFLSTLMGNREDFDIDYHSNDGSVKSLKGQQYDIALEAIDACLLQGTHVTHEMSASAGNPGNGSGGDQGKNSNWFETALKNDGVDIDKEQVLASPGTNVDASGVGGLGLIHEDLNQ